MTRRQAFTLIELLVVIAIIAILAAILFPVFAQAREKARAATCISNEKQMASAVMLYTQDYDETILPWYTYQEYAGQPRRERTWVWKIGPYVKSGTPQPNQEKPAGVFACPSFASAHFLEATDQADCDGDGTPGSSGFGGIFPPTEFYAHYGLAFQTATLQGDGSISDPYWQYPGSYAYPVDVAGEDAVTRSLAQIARPAETAFLSDGVTLYVAGMGVLDTMGCEGMKAHQEGGNFAFLDGHVKRIGGNPARYLDQRSDGAYYERYFTFPF